jgi:hypothetical protein
MKTLRVFETNDGTQSLVRAVAMASPHHWGHATARTAPIFGTHSGIARMGHP